jgi:hypothetical protein
VQSGLATERDIEELRLGRTRSRPELMPHDVVNEEDGPLFDTLMIPIVIRDA